MTSADRDPAAVRPHSLAPAHLGEARAGAALAIGVLGVALFITAIGIVVAGLTAPASYDPGNPPPNAAELGTWQIVGGAVVFVIGVALVGGALGLLTGSSRPRVPTGVLALVTALASLAGAVAVIVRGPSDLILSLALLGLALGLGGAGVILLRRRR